MPETSYAERFAIEHAHYAIDRDFWRAEAERLGSPILDIGAASGRIAVDLAAEGHEVWALDASAAMLDELGRRAATSGPDVAARITTICADMRAFTLDARFALAMLPMNTLQFLLDRADQLACLERIRAHLVPAGELAFDVAQPDFADIEGALGMVLPAGEHRDAPGRRTLVHSAWYESLDRATGTAHFALRNLERHDDGAERSFVRRFRVHLFAPSELAALIEATGFRVTACHGDFDRSPLYPDSERQIYRCALAL